MKTDPAKWRVEEQDGAASRVLVVEAPTWEAAIQSVWDTWGKDHDLRRAGVEVGLSATQVFIRGTSCRYRVAPERPPPKRTVPRPVSSIPPPMAAPEAKPEPEPEPKKAPPPRRPEPPKKVEPKKTSARKGDLPSGRSLFGKLPRPSSPDLEDQTRPAPRASQPDRDEVTTSESRLKVPTPPPLPVAELAKAIESGHRPPSSEPPPAPEASPSIIPTPVVDVGKSAPPPEPEPEPAVAAPVPAAPAPAPVPARPIPTLEPRRLQVLVSGAVQLYTREQDPKNGAPVIYRQVGYALPMGTEEEEGEVFGRWMLEQLKRNVPKGSAPRLFHLAVYDEMFTGDPPILALCKLEWKEWKDLVSVSFPRRGDDSVMVAPPRARTPSMHPEMSVPQPPPGIPGAAKAPGRVSALFLPPVTPPSFAVQPPPKAPAASTDESTDSDEK